MHTTSCIDCYKSIYCHNNISGSAKRVSRNTGRGIRACIKSENVLDYSKGLKEHTDC